MAHATTLSTPSQAFRRQNDSLLAQLFAVTPLGVLLQALGLMARR